MFHGSMVALVTPMDIHGEIDWQPFDKLLEFHLQEGTDAIVVCGTTGESATLSFDEKKQLIHRACEIVNKKVPVIAGTNSQSTREAIALTEMAQSQGVDACLIMTPAYIKPTDNGLLLHYQMIAESSPLPIILYNVPSRTACDMSVVVIEKLAAISNIIGIKDASGSLDKTAQLVERCADKLDIYSGEDALTLEMLKLGAKGVISVTANVVPHAMKSMCELALKGKYDEAGELNQKLNGLHEVLFCQSNPIPVKWALSQMNFMSPHARLPLTMLDENYHCLVYDELKKNDLVS